VPAEVKRAVMNANQGPTNEMRTAINSVAEQIKTLAGDNMGHDFSQIVGQALSENASLKDIRRKSDQVQGATEVMQLIMERKLGGMDDPVVHAVFQ